MMDSRQIEEYCRCLRFPELGQAYLNRVRSAPASRSVNSRVGNIVGRFPSRKMGYAVSTESLGELAQVYRMEHDSDVLEFYEQPESIKLVYPALSGRMTGSMHTPDFLVLRCHSVGWVEIKPEDRLNQLTETRPHCYVHDEFGVWRSPPGEEAGKLHGFTYRIVSTAELNPILTRNLEFLDDYFRDPIQGHVS